MAVRVVGVTLINICIYVKVHVCAFVSSIGLSVLGGALVSPLSVRGALHRFNKDECTLLVEAFCTRSA